MTAMKRNITEKRLTQSMFNAPNQQSQHTMKKKRRRAYEATGLNIQPYRKKPKLTTAELLSNDDPHKEAIQREICF